MKSTKTLANIHDLIDISLLAASKLGTEVWWRGHSQAHWNLVPSVYRGDRKPRDEVNLAVRFFHRAPTRYPNCPPEGDFPGWLFLMQHYRLPTRLLDWTESILVAAHFACKEYPTENAELWALSPYLLNEVQVGERAGLTAGDSRARQLFRPPFTENYEPSDAILAVSAREMDLRMTVQLSAFTIHGTTTPLEDAPEADKYLLKFNIPTISKNSISAYLFHLGIRESTLFPDLDHLASDLSRLEFDSDDNSEAGI